VLLRESSRRCSGGAWVRVLRHRRVPATTAESAGTGGGREPRAPFGLTEVESIEFRTCLGAHIVKIVSVKPIGEERVRTVSPRDCTSLGITHQIVEAVTLRRVGEREDHSDPWS
jgi:hypothetical protein